MSAAGLVGLVSMTPLEPLLGAVQEHAAGEFHPFAPALILALPLLGALLNGIGAFRWRENKTVPSLVGPLAVLSAFVVVLVNFIGMNATQPHDPVITSLWSWIVSGDLGIGIDLRLDQLSMLMCMIVTGVGGLIHVYSVGYMRTDPGFSRYMAYLNLFIFFMLVLVLGANFPMMFVGWEGVGLCSYLLIGFWYDVKSYSDAGRKAFVVNRIGDVGFLIAMFLIFVTFGALDFASVISAAPGTLTYGGPLVTVITLLLFLGCTGKSAQIPLFVWLPDAMAGPTPVSALIHAATMVTAGVYLIARTATVFVMAPVTMAVVAAVGAGTAIFAATIALKQYDIKRVLAYSTISQLGYMFLAMGVGAFTAGIFHLMTHAFFKALLFLGAGAVIHMIHDAYHHTDRHTDPNDMRDYGGLKKHMPTTWITMWVATLAIAGIFPFAGFFSKDEIIWYAGAYGYSVLWIVALVTAVLTAVYMTRMMVLTFHGENRTGEERRWFHEVPGIMWIPLVILAVMSVVDGWVQIPAALPLPHVEWLHHWLEPVFEPAVAVMGQYGIEAAHEAPFGGGEAMWAGISTVLALIAVMLAFRFYSGRKYVSAAESEEPAGFAGILYHKWYVDEFYDRLIVRPLAALWRACWRVVDDGLIDGSINALGGGARLVGWVGSQFQTGRVVTYLWFFLAGAVIILGALAW